MFVSNVFDRSVREEPWKISLKEDASKVYQSVALYGRGLRDCWIKKAPLYNDMCERCRPKYKDDNFRVMPYEVYNDYFFNENIRSEYRVYLYRIYKDKYF